MSSYTPFTEAQIDYFSRWFKRYVTPGKGVFNARNLMATLKLDKEFRQFTGIKFIENEFFFKVDADNRYKLEFCWSIHVRDVDVDFPEFVRLVALFCRKLKTSDEQMHAKVTAPIVQRPTDLEVYLTGPDAHPNRVPFIDDYDSFIHHAIFPPYGDPEDQPCFNCCCLGLLYALPMSLACIPLIFLQVASADFKYTELVPKAFENEPWSLLHWAVWHGNEESIKLLIKHGASPDVAANASNVYPCRITPYDLAVYLRTLRAGYQVSEETIRLLEPIEMRMARDQLKKEATPGYQAPSPPVASAPAPNAGASSNAGALVPRVEDDMDRDDETSGGLRKKLEDGIEDAVKDAAEDAADEATNQVLDDDAGDEAEEEAGEEAEEEAEEAAEEIMEAATGGAVSGFIRGMFS